MSCSTINRFYTLEAQHLRSSSCLSTTVLSRTTLYICDRNATGGTSFCLSLGKWDFNSSTAAIVSSGTSPKSSSLTSSTFSGSCCWLSEGGARSCTSGVSTPIISSPQAARVIKDGLSGFLEGLGRDQKEHPTEDFPLAEKKPPCCGFGLDQIYRPSTRLSPVPQLLEEGIVFAESLILEACHETHTCLYF